MVDIWLCATIRPRTWVCDIYLVSSIAFFPSRLSY